MRIILYTGKGGVGKTSVAAATALRCAKQGYRTLIMSTDPAHSLGDSLDMELGDRPLKVGDNLWAHEVSALHEMEHHWLRLREYATSVFASQGLDEVMAEEVATPPGMDEVASLLWIRTHAEKGDYDVLVVDCAPTGETLQLLTFPDAAKWWLDKIFPWERRAMRIARPVLQPLMKDIPLPGDDVFGSLKELLIDLEGMKELLADTSVTSARIVLNLEKMVVKEAKRAFTYLSLFGYLTDAVIVNRVLPAGADLGYLHQWRDIHDRHRAEVEEAFAGVPILEVPMFDSEVVGGAMLEKMGDALYGDRDPSDRFVLGSPQRVEKVGREYILALRLPFTDKRDIDLSRHDDEVVVTIGNHRRDISLPRTLASRDILGAAMEGDELKIRFGSIDRKSNSPARDATATAGRRGPGKKT